MLVPLCAIVFLCLTSALRMRRVAYASEVSGPPSAGGEWRPRLIVPGHNSETYEWLDQTRQMFARREWRVRHVDYENAPIGRDVYESSPFRWWIGLIAAAHHGATGTGMGRSIEWSALVAGPLFLLLLGAGTTVFVARRFGVLAAALLSAGLVALFPFAGEFVPGLLDYRGFAQGFALWSVLPLLAAGAGDKGPDGGRRRRRWYFAAGVVGGVGLWVSVTCEAPILAGIALGGLLVSWVARSDVRAGRAAPLVPLPWRAWALGGSVTCLFAYFAEFFPSHMGSWDLRSIHPVFGIAWLGGGEILARLTGWIQGEKPRWGFRNVAIWVLSLCALASVPATMWLTHNLGFLEADLASMRLSQLPEAEMAPNLWAWLLRNGFTPAVWATFLPLVLIVPALGVLVLRSFETSKRCGLALALGPVAVALGFSLRQITWWNGLDSTLLLLLVATAASLRGTPRPRIVAWTSGVLAALVLVPGAVRLWPSTGPKDELTRTEVISLVERDLAYWLAMHVGHEGAIALAPPSATTALYYYGGIRGLGSFDGDSRDGIRAAVRIVSALTPEEANELITLRGITHIVIPAWDPYMDTYARMGEGQVASTFLERLHLWLLPPWLRPVPYLIPSIEGFEGQSVVVLEVVDDQDAATSASRLAEYFVDMGQLDLAANTLQALRRFPSDLGAQLARAEVAIAQGDLDEFTRDVDLLLRRISNGADKELPWDQRVGLAVVLAQSHHIDLARVRLKQCLDEVDDEKLRSLSTNSLYRLQVLSRALGLSIADPRLRDLSMELLPADLRSRLVK
jgi:hypothetical protein